MFWIIHVDNNVDLVHSMTAMWGMKASSGPQTELFFVFFFLCKCEAAAWVAVLLHMRVSACLDRVSLFISWRSRRCILEIGVFVKGRVFYHPGLVFELPSCLKIRSGGLLFSFFFKFSLPIRFSLCSHHHKPLSIAVSYKKQFNC